MRPSCYPLALALIASLLLGAPSALAQQTSPAPSPRAAMIAGVPALASAGNPGPLAAFGERAFVIAVGKDDKSSVLPVAVGATWDKGRVVALGHGGMISDRALEHAGTRAFVHSATVWLGGSPKASVGVFKNEAMVKLLNEAGLSATPLNGKWHESLAGFAAVVVDSHSIGPAERAALAEYITRGGGLLTAGLGWGWLQLNPGKTIQDHPGNLLLVDAGIAWCDGTLDPTGNGEFLIGEVAPALHAASAMNELETAARDRAELSAQASKTLISALRVLPPQHPLTLRAAALLETGGDQLAPSQGKPLKAKDGVARVLLSMQVELEKRTPPEKVKPHPGAASFPGGVPADARRVTKELELDLSIPQWHSTGLYAAPGEVITVTVADPRGASVRIGCHTDHLWHHDRWSRVPDISREWRLTKGETRVASAFGGLVYIDVPDNREGTARFTIAGAVESPRYVLGVTTADEWRSSREAPGPWGEIESRSVIISVPSSALRTLESPDRLIEFWDQI
ncbi:MAG: M60 family peptidase N-terminal accessory domain-containing protein, partial [Phycisphaerales bacterium]